MKIPEIDIIAVVAADGAIGRNGDLLWHLPGDLRHFKELTSGHAVIMGRLTWESLPKRPLPGRLNIVVTHDRAYEAPGALLARDLGDALRIVAEKGEGKAFVIGGGQIYAQAMPMATRLHLTEVIAEAPDADTWFPPLDRREWARTGCSGEFEAADGRPAYCFVTYTRREPAGLSLIG